MLDLYRTDMDVNHPLYAEDPNALSFRWEHDLHLAAIDPWPRYRLGFADGLLGEVIRLPCVGRSHRWRPEHGQPRRPGVGV